MSFLAGAGLVLLVFIILGVYLLFRALAWFFKEMGKQ
jgi:hypothetical protein